MSGASRRRARQAAQRQRSGRQRGRPVEARRRRPGPVLVVVASVLAVVAVITLLVVLVSAAGGRDPGVEAAQDLGSEILESEAAADAQAAATAEAMEAGEVVAEDYTVEPGTPVDSGLLPVPDDRPVACGAQVPANAGSSRPRYPGGPLDLLDEGVDYVAVMATSCGPITIDLLEKEAPKAVNSFVFLAREGFYDGLEVFRDFGGIAAVQAGSGTNAVDWSIGYRLPDELDLAEREGYPIGTVTTVGRGPYSAGSEFFIAYGKEFDLGYQTDRTQTAFGRVLSGMRVLFRMDALDRVTMGGEKYAERLFMESVTVEER